MTLKPPSPGQLGYQEWRDLADAVDAAGVLGAGVADKHAAEFEAWDRQSKLACTPEPGKDDPTGAWRPIESAPLDANAVWLLVNGAVVRGVWCEQEFREHRDTEGRYLGQQDADAFWMDLEAGSTCEPSHWQPILKPQPPCGVVGSQPWEVKVHCSKGERTLRAGMRWADSLHGGTWEIVEPSGKRIYSPSGFGGTPEFWCKPVSGPNDYRDYARDDGCVEFCGDSIAAQLIDAAGVPEVPRG